MQNLYDYTGNELIIREAGYVTPEQFGAVGDGVVDDTLPIQNAINNCAHVIFMGGKNYKTTTPLRLKNGAMIDLNGAVINCSHRYSFYNFMSGDSYGGYNGNGNITIKGGTIIGGCVSFIHGENIKILDVQFMNATAGHYIEICACKNFVVEGCYFCGMQNLDGLALEYINIDTNASYPAFPYNTQTDTTFYDMSTSRDIKIINCDFSVGDGDFAYGWNAFGAHARNVDATYTDNLTFIGNRIKGFSLCGIRVSAMRHVYIEGNYIDADGDGILIGDKADAHDIVIQGNFINSANGQAIATTSGQFSGLVESGNVSRESLN